MKPDTTICRLKDDKACAVTFTTDDALYRSCVFYQSRFKEYGLKGTLVFSTHFISPPPKNMPECNDFASWEQWQAFLSEGHFDVANHTKSHPYLNQITPEQLEDEINGAQEVLREKFPGQKVLCFASPYVVTDEASEAVIRQRHFSARNGGGGFNSLNPTEHDWYWLKLQAALHDSTAEGMNAWVDQAIEGNLWLIEMWHGVDGQWWEPPAAEECDKHLLYLSEKLGTVWNGTMEEVTLYIRERQHASVVTEYKNETELHVFLETDLDSSLFDYPLTLRTEVPPDWNAARLICGNQDQTLAVREMDGHQVVYYDAVPNTGTLILRKA